MRTVLYALGLLSDADVDWLAATGSRQVLKPDQVIIREGQSVQALFMVVEGELKVLLSRPAVREVARLGQGEMVGEMSFIDSRPPSATVAAAGRTVVLSIQHSVMTAKLACDAAFAARFYKALAVFLSHRLRKQLMAGFNIAAPDDEEPDELAPEVLEELAIAGARYDYVLSRLKGR